MSRGDSAPLAEVDLGAELALAHDLAEMAEAETLELFHSRDFRVDHKPDRSEVTAADRAAETAMVEIITSRRPHHAIVGEEYGRQGAPDAVWSWIVDPVDGTSNFVRGVPVWATLIALVHEDLGPVLGVVSAPALGRKWWAHRGGGAFANGRPIHVSEITQWSSAHASLNLADGWGGLGLEDALWRLGRDCGRLRGFGDFWQHMLVAEGALDAAVDAVGLAPYDIAALVPIVEEAGGRFSDHRGDRRLDSATAITTNGHLHQAVLAALGAPRD